MDTDTQQVLRELSGGGEMKRIGKYIILLVIANAVKQSICFAQNLVPNPSFEDTVGGTPCYSSITGAKHWFNPHGATPDYYTYFPGYCTGYSSINNPSGFQLARTGNAYAGIYGMAHPTRDYIAVRLLDSLVSGQCYYAEYYVSLANMSRYAIDNLGCYFTKDTTGYKSITTNIPVVPQVINQPGRFLSDTMNWQKVSGTFTVAGGEVFLIIGNFYDDANTVLDTVLPSSTWEAAYYYIDDVRVIVCDSINNIVSKRGIKNVFIYPAVSASFVTIYSKQRKAEDINISIYDMQGRLCTLSSPAEYTGDGWQLNISNLSSGMYVVALTGKSLPETNLKFIKQ